MTVYRAAHRRANPDLPRRIGSWLLYTAAVPLLVVAVFLTATDPYSAGGFWWGATGLALALCGWYLHPSTPKGGQ